MIKSYQIVEKRGILEVELSPIQEGRPTARVNVIIRAGKKVLNFLATIRDRLVGVIVRALGGSRTPEDFYARFRKEFRAKFKGDLSDAELNELNIEMAFFLRVEDQYLSEGPNNGCRSRVAG